MHVVKVHYNGSEQTELAELVGVQLNPWGWIVRFEDEEELLVLRQEGGHVTSVEMPEY